MERMEIDPTSTGSLTPRQGASQPHVSEAILALPVQVTPRGTLIVPPNEHILLHRTDSGNLRPVRGEINEAQLEPRRLDFNEEEYLNSPARAYENDDILPFSLAEALEVDSGSEIDEMENFNEDDLLHILDDDQNEEGNIIAEAGLNWSENFDEFTGTQENYEEQSGPVIQETSPIEIFKAIWNLQIMEHIVEETNKYAWNIIARASESEEGISKASRLNDWDETTVGELYQFFSVLIYMSLCYRARLDEYWTVGILGMPSFRKIMSKNKFLLLLRFLHFVDNDALTDSIHGYDKKTYKTYKNAPIVEHCNNKFAEIYIPKRDLSIDESLLLWKGRLSWVQCIRTKSARFGIKSYELCEAQSGYLLKFIIYAGKSQDSGQAIHGFTNVTSKVVLKLIEGYLQKGHCLYMDNYYNSVSLTRFLKSKRTDVVGTLNRRRVDVPSKIKNLDDRRMQRGEIVATHCGDVTVLSWKDVKLVSMISTFHKNDKAPGYRAGVECAKPLAVHDYNKYMGGVDLKDQKLSMYLLERKRGLKWYIKVFRRLLNCSILNSYIVHNLNDPENKMDHRRFRYVLAEALSLENNTKVRIRPAAAPNTSCDRYTGDHFPAHFSENTANVRENKRKNLHKRGRCVYCTSNKRRQETNIICTGCDVFLCVGQCWRKYHNPPSPTAQ